MHKARVARRNYHKDRAGIEDTRAREGTEILYTWINLRYISLKRRPGPVTRLPLPELDFAYFRRCESGPCLYPHLSCSSLSLSIDNRGLNFNELRSLCMFARNFLCSPVASTYRSLQNNLQRNFGTVRDVSQYRSRRQGTIPK